MRGFCLLENGVTGVQVDDYIARSHVRRIEWIECHLVPIPDTFDFWCVIEYVSRNPNLSLT